HGAGEENSQQGPGVALKFRRHGPMLLLPVDSPPPANTAGAHGAEEPLSPSNASPPVLPRRWQPSWPPHRPDAVTIRPGPAVERFEARRPTGAEAVARRSTRARPVPRYGGILPESFTSSGQASK